MGNCSSSQIYKGFYHNCAAVAVEEVSEEEVAALVADAVPTTSRLRTNTGRTRAIARTRQSERVRATVNRNRIRITQAQTAQVPNFERLCSPIHLCNVMNDILSIQHIGFS
ncbi:PHD and RING finger domain-containing protein 1 [Acipenser ruthenus]|uniref:PHD and RING finger domain-containing protein 1 n=1 Tax=Acipenser ruthenus TaxID=7906 RepID=A0A662Z011_ACIRT|nr:PHD and RING finger domain-containing protein 1 [Acipenser ruthenus]